MRSMIVGALLASACMAGPSSQVGWQFTFDTAGFGGGKYSPIQRDGTAHYVLDHGYIANLQQEFPALTVAEYPFFAIRARNIRGGLFVKFKVDGQWQKHWVIGGWMPKVCQTRFVDLRKYGEKVSGLWLNSQSSIDGAEWLLDWLGLVKSENPLNISIMTAGGLVRLPEGRNLRFTLRNGLGTDARLVCTVAGRSPDDAFRSQESVDTKVNQSRRVDLRVPARPGARYELSVEDRDTKALYYQESLTVPPVVEARMVVPSYRNAIYATQKLDRVRVACRLNVLPPVADGLRIRTRLMHGDKAVREAETTHREVEARLEVPCRGLSAGEYRVEIELGRGDQVLGRQRLPLHVYGSCPNEVRIDEDLNTLVAGRPFLPVGFYSVPRKHLETVAQIGFTAVLTYGSGTEGLKAYLDEAERVGLKAVVHSPAKWFGKDGEARLREAVAALKDKPALLGWYLIDEPSNGRDGQRPADLGRLYALMQELDPYHPTFTVYCQPAQFALYRDTHDVFMCDPYPVGNRPLTFVAEWTKLGKEAMAGRKPVHIVPQSFGSEKGPQTWWHMPTAEEEMCMGYLALVHGAKGLFYYRFDVQQYDKTLADAGKWPWPTIGYLPELRPAAWAGLGEIGRQLRQLAPVILASEPKTGVTVFPRKPGLHVTLREYQGQRYLIAVNPAAEAIEATMAVEGMKASKAEVLFEDRQVAVNAGVLKDSFAKLAVHVYRFE